jgi:hypothetical protein
MVEISEHGVILQQVCQRFRVREIIYGDDINIRITYRGTKNIASDAPKTVDANLHRHFENALLPIVSARIFLHLSRQGTHIALPHCPSQDPKLAGN